MFLLRSAFWLTAAFLVIRPDVDFDTGAISASAVATGQQLIAGAVLSNACASLICRDGKAVLTAVTSSTPSLDATMQDSSNNPVPFPRPRPDWMG